MTIYDGIKLFFLKIGRAIRDIFITQKPVVYRTPAPNAPVHYLPDDTNIYSLADVQALGIGVVTDETWDLQGAVLDGKNQRGGGGQAENQEPLFTLLCPLTLKNGFVRNQKESIRVVGVSANFDALTFTNIGEDAISTFGAVDNVDVNNCEFINHGGDKCLQFNTGRSITVRNSLLYGCITGIRWGSRDGGATLGTSRDNRFIKVERGHNCAGPQTVVTSKGDTYLDVDGKYIVGDGAKFIQT